MGKKIYVGNIAFAATEADLRELFEKFGQVESVKLITDAGTGRSKGFGFIDMAAEDDAQKAISALNSTAFMERTLTVSEARPQQPKERRGFGNRGFGSGGDRGGAGHGGYDRNRGPGRGRR
jgi:RNA recognition motif-containing protein